MVAPLKNLRLKPERQVQPYCDLFPNINLLPDPDPNPNPNPNPHPHQVQPYCDLFPRIDPRDFRITGEASPSYLYSAPALAFYMQPNLRMTRLVILLREPAERTASQHLEGRREWTGPESLPLLARRAAREVAACGIESLYASCVPCARFVRSEQRHGVAPPAGGAGGGGDAGGAARCGAWVAPPVLWQSWYHLFLPRWLAAGDRLLLAFSDDLLSRPEARAVLPSYHPSPFSDDLLSRPEARAALPSYHPYVSSHDLLSRPEVSR